MTDATTMLDRVATAAEHRSIAESVGWHDAFDWTTIADSLAGSTFGVVAHVGSEAVGMGRVVGDGVKYFYIQDLAVIPAFQGTGLGARLLDRLTDRIAATAPTTAFVGLFSTAAGTDLYASRGFGSGDMTGLFRLIEPAPRDERQNRRRSERPDSRNV
ncbi:GNAT family N-acetyltransferase [Microbacterium sp. UFMG61]|uniref:GNAT family N-acetyltransferase n=1 Tax=Microbacterium sp. UFMG61 TaxID=2745935 RepID=UPI00188E3637|nr:GNAT family N-acetyltransferase [Microbacterium sp. UFMG61]